MDETRYQTLIQVLEAQRNGAFTQMAQLNTDLILANALVDHYREATIHLQNEIEELKKDKYSEEPPEKEPE